MLVGSVFVEDGAGTGWTLYRYLAAWGIPAHLWIWLFLVCIWRYIFYLGAINFISTIFNMRASGVD